MFRNKPKRDGKVRKLLNLLNLDAEFEIKMSRQI